MILTGRSKQAIERHFDKSCELEEELKSAEKYDRLERAPQIAELADIHYVRQKERDGLGDAIIQTETLCEPHRQSEVHETSVLSLEHVPWDAVPSYGVADIGEVESADATFPVKDFIEKPLRERVPSNLAITGWCVLTPEIFELLETPEKGVGGELQLTDAIRKLYWVWGIKLDGDRYDIGNIPSWLRAKIKMALTYDDEMNGAVEELLEDYHA